MKEIEDYTIFCTQEQAKRALTLGAKIKEVCRDGVFSNGITIIGYDYVEDVDERKRELICPTSEQMIGWLEGRGLNLHVYPIYRGGDYCVGYKYSCEEIERNIYSDIYSSRKEATLAAIDLSLTYLEKKH